MTQTTKLIASAIVALSALILIFLADEKTAGVTLLLAVASGWGFPPRRRPAASLAPSTEHRLTTEPPNPDVAEAGQKGGQAKSTQKPKGK